MKKMLRLLCLSFACITLLVGCDKDNTPPPTPLSKMAPEALDVKTLWTNSGTSGAGSKYLTLGSGLSSNVLVSAGVDGHVKAINADNGSTAWDVTLPAGVSGTPALDDNYVFVTTINGYLYCLNQKTGATLWKEQLPSTVLGAPAATDDVVVVACHDGSVEAFSTDTGHILWSYNGSVPNLTLYANSSPLIYNGKVFVGFANGQLAAFDLYQGQALWDVPVALPASPDQISGMVDVDANPIVDNDAIFSVAYHGNLMAIASANGNPIWQAQISSFETPAINNERVLVTDETGRVVAYDEASGQEVWENRDLLYRFISPPASLNNWVIVGDYEGYVHFMSLDHGQMLARFHTNDSGIRAQPLVYGNDIIVTTNNGVIYALEASAASS